MNKKELELYKNRLISEKKQIEEELKGVGQRTTANPSGWEANAGETEVDTADESEVADKMEEYEDNAGIANQLEKQLVEINEALTRINKGTYGLCEICNLPIEKERLDANPAARNSIKHSHK